MDFTVYYAAINRASRRCVAAGLRVKSVCWSESDSRPPFALLLPVILPASLGLGVGLEKQSINPVSHSANDGFGEDKPNRLGFINWTVEGFSF